jgi:tetratricopeptide (TPR) repeat protein
MLRAAVVSHLGSLYTAQDRMAEALPLFNQAIEIQRKALPESRTALLFSLEALGSGWFTRGRYQQAEVCLREAWQLSHDLPPDHPGRADTATHLGSVLVMEGKSDRALPLLKSAQSIYERTLGGHARQLGAVLTMLARMDTSEKHYAMAEEKLQRVLT